MQCALECAHEASRQGEVPVGAVIVRDDAIIAKGWNQPIASKDPTAHAEIVALRLAAFALENYRLTGLTLYVTLEPCVMCVGAMMHARIGRLVFGALDPKAGAVTSQLSLITSSHFNHRMDYTGGVLHQACGSVLTDFFKARRIL